MKRSFNVLAILALVGFLPARVAAQACGDGVLDPGECCDEGERGNSDVAPDACRTDCRIPYCGDGTVDTGTVDWPRCTSLYPYHFEECDDRERNADHEPNTCRSDCTLPVCGDGVVDDAPEFGEECDHGPGNSDAAGAICSTECRLRGCGNGLLEVEELCDDGNTSDADGCTSQCRPNVCGDGRVWADVEMCEYESPWDAGTCRYDCGQSPSLCGNGVLDGGEGCDAGGDRNNDAPDNPCRSDCQVARCGDGVVDAGEECDRQPGCAPDCRWITPR